MSREAMLRILITLQRCTRITFGFMIFTSLVYTFLEAMRVAVVYLNQASPSARPHIAVALLFIIVIAVVLEALSTEGSRAIFFRDIAEQMVQVFNPDSTYNEDAAKFIYKFWMLTEAVAPLYIGQWCLVTLVYGSEFTENYFMSTKKAEALGIANSTIRVEELWKVIQYAKGGENGLREMASALLIIAFAYGWMLYTNALEASLKRPTLTLWWLRMQFGFDFVDCFMHACYYGVFLNFFSIIPLLADWINEEYIYNLNWFSGFFLINMTSYMVYIELTTIIYALVHTLRFCLCSARLYEVHSQVYSEVHSEAKKEHQAVSSEIV